MEQGDISPCPAVLGAVHEERKQVKLRAFTKSKAWKSILQDFNLFLQLNVPVL